MEEFIDLVKKMRDAQTHYFAARRAGNKQEAETYLIQSKMHEREVDLWIEEYDNHKSQLKLF
jgi:hypothetical protein